MSTVNVFDGGVWLSPDLPVGYGNAISSPATVLADMVAQGVYYREIGGESDAILINAGDSKLISMYKSLENQRACSQFVARSSNIGGQNRVRWVHRPLALSMTTEQMLKSIGVNQTVSDDFSSLSTINQALAGHFIQIWSS